MTAITAITALGSSLMYWAIHYNLTDDGYITLDRHYDVLHAEEVRTLNWVGPGYGEYFTSIIKKVIERDR